MTSAALQWFLLGMLGLVCLAGLALARGARRQDTELAALRQWVETTAGEARRSHIRLDNQDRVIAELARELGWSDDRTHTKVLTLPIPKAALPSDPPEE